MSLRIKLVSSTEELDQVFQVRHRVLVGDGFLQPHPDGRVVDRFDAFPGTANFAVLSQDRVIGSIRFVEDVQGIGVEADRFFDFSSHLPRDARHGSLSMLCLEKEFRGQKHLFVGLVGMGTYYAISRGITFMRAATNPDIEDHLLRMGYKSVAPAFVDKVQQLPVVPMVLSIDDLSDVFVDFIHGQNLNELIDSFDRCFFDKGEVIIQAGDPGHEAFILTEGQVGVSWKGTGSVDSTLERGDLFGEIALLTGRPRTASVMALSDVSVMVINRSVFQQRLEQYPHVARDLLKVIANRLAERAVGPVEDPEL